MTDTTTTEVASPGNHGTPGPSSPAPAGWRRVARVLLLLGLALLALWVAACDVPGPIVGTGTKDGVAKVLGTNGSEAITLRLQAGDPTVIEVDVAADGTSDFQFDRDAVDQIVVKGFGGDDTLRIDASNGVFTDTEATQLLGGDGDDTLVGGSFAEVLSGGAGDDHLDGNQGADSLAGNDGIDVFQWDPGDGNDSLAGGRGADVLRFSGSGANEIYDVAPAEGGHVSLARNIGNVVLDLDDVETVEAHPLGGADLVHVADLAGTDLTDLDVDLAASGGGDDAQTDEVTVSPGAEVGWDDSAVTVDVGARVRLLNGAPTDRLHVAGTTGVDVASVVGSEEPESIWVTANGVEVAVSGPTPGPLVALSAVEHLDVDLRGGDDQFSTAGNLAALIAIDVDGGDGDDTLLGSNGADVLSGGPGVDLVDGNQGIDIANGDSGADVFQWDPGDGNDALVGGSGADRLVFNGSATNEIYELTSVGDHVRFFRNVGSIVLDLDEVETIDARPLGGSDLVKVFELSGTDLTRLNTDLAGTGGVDDAAVDEVLVGPGLEIGRDGAAATIDGLGSQVRVVNGGPGDAIRVTGTAGADVVPVAGTDGPDVVNVTANGTEVAVDGATPGVFVRLSAVETLDVDLGGGADQFGAVGNLAALIAIQVDGGDDADTLMGGNGADVLSGGPGADFVDGNQGIDTANGDAGADVFQWDPGDGNDVLVGGSEADRLLFHGSSANEIIDVSAAAGGHARLTRNLASIVMDLDEIETVDVRTLGGADIVNPTDVTGTDLATVNADFASTIGGGDDALADEVVVGPGLEIGRDGAAATVGGLGAQVRVLNGGLGDAIRVNGTVGADVVPVVGTDGADVVNATANGAEVAVSGATPGVFVRLSAVETLDVDLGDGDDQFAAAGNLAALIAVQVDGGDHADTLLGTNGADVLSGGPGADFLDGNQGVDTLVGDAGSDVFQWDPGDGNDVLVGGADADRLVFNGSSIAEIIDVSAAAGGHARFTRNIGSVVLDLDDIETVEVRSVGGADVLTVADLTGTEITAVDAHLALISGADDAQVDQVVVNGSPGNDQIAVVDDGSAVVVQGLTATVRVTGAGVTTPDLLRVQGLAGDDTITATPGAEALMLLELIS